MSLRNQPYLPLYIQDFLTDEKLSECSACTTGVFIRLMCLMHKSDHYGKILLKQKHKQTGKQVSNFALQIAKNMPYDVDTVESALIELLAEKVLEIDAEYLIQKRMVKDNAKSEIRAKAGSVGGKKTSKHFAKANAKAKIVANTENENEYESENEVINDIKTKKVKAPKTENDHPLAIFIKTLPNVSQLEEMTFDQCEKIVMAYDKPTIQSTLEAMENKPDLKKKYKSQYLTLNNWLKNAKTGINNGKSNIAGKEKPVFGRLTQQQLDEFDRL